MTARCCSCSCGRVHRTESATNERTSTTAAAQLNSHTGTGRSARPTMPCACALAGRSHRGRAERERGREREADPPAHRRRVYERGAALPVCAIIGCGERVILAHLAGIPVEEWAPFWVPVVLLLVWGWRRERRAAPRSPSSRTERDLLDSGTQRRVIAACRAAGLGEIEERHLKILYPPGPGRPHDRADRRAQRTRGSERGAPASRTRRGRPHALDGKPGPDQQAFLTMRRLRP